VQWAPQQFAMLPLFESLVFAGKLPIAPARPS
jgi:hypothetical protein